VTYRYPYRICVRRAHDPRRAVCYRAPLEDRLPVIRIPLRPDDSDARLDLQELIDRAWHDGGYDGLAHTRGLLPPLNDKDAEWVRERLRSAAGGSN
jgi:hypothetical protein